MGFRELGSLQVQYRKMFSFKLLSRCCFSPASAIIKSRAGVITPERRTDNNNCRDYGYPSIHQSFRSGSEGYRGGGWMRLLLVNSFPCTIHSIVSWLLQCNCRLLVGQVWRIHWTHRSASSLRPFTTSLVFLLYLKFFIPFFLAADGTCESFTHELQTVTWRRLKFILIRISFAAKVFLLEFDLT